MKHPLLVDRHGTPLACLITPANAHDGRYLRPLVQRLARRVGRLLGRKGHADEVCDRSRKRAALHEVGAEDRIARKGREGGGLGRHRWVIERSFSHLAGFHRLERCHERDPWQLGQNEVLPTLASLQLACILKLARALLRAGCYDKV